MLLRTTPQERQALGITALLLLAGAGVRIAAAPGGEVEWHGAGADTLVADGLAAVREAAGAELEREQIRAKPLVPGEKLDPNAADELQLDRLPRVGPALARAIVEWREANGPFRSLADLDAVPGIGPALLESLAPLVTLPARAALSPQLSVSGGPPSSARGAAERRVSINRAGEEELQSLPGIGPALAARIVASRRADGPFGSVDEMERVPGVGPVLVERLAPLVTVER